MYEKELKEYLEKRYEDCKGSIGLLTGGNQELFAYMQLMWTNQFYIKRTEELGRVIAGLEDVVEGKDGEIANMQEEVDFLDCLKAHGVDNWEGFAIANNQYQKEKG